MANTENAAADFHSELNLFEQPTYQTSLTDEYEYDTYPIAALSSNGASSSPIEFTIRGSDNTFFDLNNSKLEVKVLVLKPVHTGTAATDVAPANLFLHSLFSSVEMEVGGKLVTDPNTIYPYRAFIETLVNMPAETMRTRMLCEGWTKDTAGQLAAVEPAKTNTGLTTRAATLAAKATRVLIGRPHIDLFHQEKLIPPNVDIKLRFIPSKPEFILIGKNNKDLYKFAIPSARMLIRAKIVTPSLLLAHAQLLRETNYRIGFNQVSSKVVTIQSGVSNYEHDNLYNGTLPDLLIMGLVQNTNISGT